MLRPVHFVLIALLLAVPALRADSLWLNDYKEALSKSKKTGHPILLAFTGSWSSCEKVDEEVFATDQFKSYAARHYILLRLDFSVDPAHQPPGIGAQNEALKEKYGVVDFPSFLVLDPQEKVSKAMAGPPSGGASGFVEALRMVEGN